MKAQQPRRRDPRADKELDYARHRRSAAEYPHAARRQVPRKKARAERAFRRGVAEALRATHDGAEVDRVHRRAVVMWKGPTLREHVMWTLEKRVERVGWNFFKHPYDRERHRQPFIRFLTALTAGRHGHSVALAARFGRILAASPEPDGGPARVSHPGAGRHRLWLKAFFADEPDWERRLRQWIDATAPSGRSC